MFGFADVIAMSANNTIVAIQCCAAGDHAKHRAKILAEPLAEWWLDCGGSILLYSWGKRKLKRGGKAVRWTARIERIELEAFDRINEMQEQEANEART